ncbi:hypothetical protein HPB49_007374 [Dermacentor silvarum]|uniref:Uncharacterized protein n=1 Tax=Dermacentor silvarum TaxID=543639 RepID=A0ACB8DBE0_DERSI|nr:hypothetical protein HPB49_007374 [Dermacentor silvarum]
MAWSEIVAEAPSSLETSTPTEEIVDEGLFSLVALRKRQQRPNTSVVSGLSVSAGVSVPPNTARSNPQLSQAAGSKKWRPIMWDQNIVIATTQDVNAANALAREFTLNASKGPIPVVGHAKVNGEDCRGIITVHEQETSTTLKSKVQWHGGEIAFIRKLGKSTISPLTFVEHRVPRYVHYTSGVTVLREYKRTIPTCFRCGAIGHPPDLCRNLQDNRCGHCGKTVTVLEDSNMAPHECTPSCILRGGRHLTGSQDCKAKLRRLQQPGNPTGQRNQTGTAVPSGPVTTPKVPTPSNKMTKGTTGPAPPAGTLPGLTLTRKRHWIQRPLHSKIGISRLSRAPVWRTKEYVSAQAVTLSPGFCPPPSKRTCTSHDLEWLLPHAWHPFGHPMAAELMSPLMQIRCVLVVEFAPRMEFGTAVGKSYRQVGGALHKICI